MFTFDGPNKLIILDPGTTQVSVSDIYSRWKDWASDVDNSKFVRAFEDSVGGNPLGGGVLLGAYYFLTNGWLIRPQEADHTLIVEGNLFPVPDTAGLFAPTVGSFNVLIAQRTSSLTQQVIVDPADAAAEIATAVWTEDLSGAQTLDTSGDMLKKAKQNSAVSVALSA